MFLELRSAWETMDGWNQQQPKLQKEDHKNSRTSAHVWQFIYLKVKHCRRTDYLFPHVGLRPDCAANGSGDADRGACAWFGGSHLRTLDKAPKDIVRCVTSPARFPLSGKSRRYMVGRGWRRNETLVVEGQWRLVFAAGNHMAIQEFLETRTLSGVVGAGILGDGLA